jgi:hypothetical protein
MILLGGLMNAVRGGQHKKLIPNWVLFENKEKNLVEKALYRLADGDLINASVYGLAVLTITQNVWLALLSALAMKLGSATGWRDYIYAIYGRDVLNRRNHLRFIEKPFERYAVSPKWGLILLSIRGLLWGMVLCVPFWVFGDVKLLPIATGACMGLVYMLIHKYFDMIGFSDDNKWAVSEWIFGVLLWSGVFLI